MKIFKNKKKWQKNKQRSVCRQAGMTYVELIVVLGIFSALTSVIIFNYGDFQSRVDIKNLASDIALKIVEAQRSSLSGLLPPATFSPASTWKPSYGVYFNLVPATENTSFISFVDLDQGSPQGSDYDGLASCTSECLTKTTITKNNYISNLDVFYASSPTTAVSIPNLAVVYVRPDSGAILTSVPALSQNISCAQITILSPKGATSFIKIYPSGRIQVNNITGC